MKKNNKGFSLVELIVVVLIMGIIAVALAPQVIKWVENSRLAADASAYDELVEEIQVSLAKKDVYGEVKGGNYYEFHFGSDGIKGYTATYADVTEPNTTPTLGTTAIAAGDEFYDALTEIDPDWMNVKSKASGMAACGSTIAAAAKTNYIVKVKCNGVVERDYAPEALQDY